MITEPRAFLVLGLPMPKGSMKCIGARGKVKHQLIEGNTPSEPWRKDVAAGARQWIEECADQYQPIALSITYTLPRPGEHYGSGRNAGIVKAQYRDARPVKHGTGDVDKLERAILDALQESGLLFDDAQVDDVSHKKRFTRVDEHGAHPPDQRPDYRDVLPVPGVVVRLYPIGENE